MWNVRLLHSCFGLAKEAVTFLFYNHLIKIVRFLWYKMESASFNPARFGQESSCSVHLFKINFIPQYQACATCII